MVIHESKLFSTTMKNRVESKECILRFSKDLLENYNLIDSIFEVEILKDKILLKKMKLPYSEIEFWKLRAVFGRCKFRKITAKNPSFSLCLSKAKDFIHQYLDIEYSIDGIIISARIITNNDLSYEIQNDNCEARRGKTTCVPSV
jgi:hypothetical protein